MRDNWEEEYKRWHAKRKLGHKITDGDFAVPFEEKPSGTFPLFIKPKKIPAVVIALMIIIPVAIALYLIYQHAIIPQNFQYNYDIGSPQDKYLTPIERISAPAELQEESITYRNLTSGLVYFEVPIARFASTVTVKARFQNNFPQGSTFSIGAKDKEEWHYRWQKIFTSDSSSKGKWVVAETTFNISDTYIKNNRLSLVFNTPHLSKANYTNYTIPVDWISINVHKKGILQ